MLDKFSAMWPEMPDTIMIEPTNNCQFKCKMCYHKHMVRRKGFISRKTYDLALQRC